MPVALVLALVWRATPAAATPLDIPISVRLGHGISATQVRQDVQGWPGGDGGDATPMLERHAVAVLNGIIPIFDFCTHSDPGMPCPASVSLDVTVQAQDLGGGPELEFKLVQGGVTFTSKGSIETANQNPWATPDAWRAAIAAWARTTAVRDILKHVRVPIKVHIDHGRAKIAGVWLSNWRLGAPPNGRVTILEVELNNHEVLWFRACDSPAKSSAAIVGDVIRAVPGDPSNTECSAVGSAHLDVSGTADGLYVVTVLNL